MNSLNIVAHPDDDLLFLNPDILQDEKSVILYMTYGDDGDITVRTRKILAVANAYGRTDDFIWGGMKSNSLKNGDPYGEIYRQWHSVKQPLVEFLQQAIVLYQPDIIRTHNPNREPAITADGKELDHADHIYTAKFVLEAAKGFPMIPVFAYEGYPIRYMQPNVEPHYAQQKKQMWRKYQEIDTEVAGNIWDVALDKCYKEQIQ